MKKTWNNRVIVLSMILTLLGVTLVAIPKYREMLSDPSETIINTTNERLDNYFLSPENDTHYQNLSIVDDWSFGQYLDIKDLAVVGHITYLATIYGLVLYNTSDPAHPTFISQTSDYYSFYKISVSDELVFLRQSYGHYLTIVNCSDLLNPVIIKNFVINDLEDLIIEGDIGYLATSDNIHGIQIYNFSDPLNPIRIGVYNLFSSVTYTSIEKQDDYLYCVSDSNTFAIFDVADVLNPTLVVTEDTYETYTSLLVIDDLLYTLSYFAFQIWNISDMLLPTLCDTVYLNGALAFSVLNNLAYIVRATYSYSEFQIYNVANPNHVTLLTTYDNLLAQYYVRISAIHIEGDIAIVTCDENGFAVLNISDYSNVTRLTFEFSGYIDGIYRVDDYAILKYTNQGIKILNITDILNPRIVSSTFIEGLYFNMFFEDDLMFDYSATQNLFFIYNVSDLTSLTEVSQFDYGSTVYDITVKNGVAVLETYNRFALLNVSDPSSPTLLYQSLSYDYLDDIEVYNDCLIIGYGVNPNYTCDILNISNPYSPVLIHQMALTRDIQNLRVNGTYLYIHNSYPTEFIIYDIEDITNPVLIKQTTLSSYLYQFVILDNLLYIFNRDTGIEIWELDSNNDFIFYGVLSSSGSFWSQTDEPAMDEDLFYIAFSDRILVIGLDSDDDNIADYLEINRYGTDPFDEDSDDDLMGDWYEITFNLDPLNGTDADLDYDGDNLTNYNESVVLTNPWMNDTDSDSLTDDLELFYGTNPLDSDTDNDILTDFEELFDYFTDPIDDDSDNDSLIDGYEILIYYTNPHKNDTDDDLIGDYYEVTNGLDPLFDDASLDLDLDGLSNYEEFLLGTYPNRSDSDYDGYFDFDEVEAGTDPMDNESHPDYPPHPLPTEPVSLFGGFLTACLVLVTSLHLLSKYRKKRRRNL